MSTIYFDRKKRSAIARGDCYCPRMPRWFCLLMLAAVVLMTATPVAGQSSASPPTLSVPYVHHVPVIEDFVRAQESADAHAAGMAMVDRLIQRAPDDGAPISERTRVYIGYDSEHVYAAFVCFDSAPSAVRGQLVGRERIPDDDDNVALQLDTFGDRKHAYTFQVSAAGVQRDGIWTESAAAWDFSFDAIWQAESRRTPYGYVVLITVPLSSLRFPAGAEQSWGLFFFREIPRKGELGFWPAYSPRVAGRLTQAASATGVRGVASAGSLQFTPYTTTQAVDDTSTAVDVSRPAVGLDTKWVIRNRYVLDATVNPDFSQIESDEPQVTANERFETFFPEKRPFFLENASYFTTPIALLFTRRIVDPQIGIRVTGRQGPYAVAALVVDDEAPGGVQSGRAVVAAARASRNVGRDGLVGTFVSTREHGANANRIVGVDGRFVVGSNWTGMWQAVATTTTEDGRPVAAGPAYAASLTRSGRSVTYTAEWHDRGAGFRAAAGYVPRSDFRSLDQALAYRFRPAGRRLIAWGPDLSVTHVWDRRGARLDSALTPRLTFEWTGPVTLALFHTLAQQRLRPTEVAAVSEPHDTDADRAGIELTFSGLERLVWSAAVSGGAAVNLQPVARGNPDPADDLEGSVTASARIARGLTIDATLLGRRVSEPASAASILQNHIWRLKATYQFTPELGVRAIVQRETLTTNAALTTLWPYTDATTDVLVTYMTAPGRALFIGASRYNDRRMPQPTSRGWQLFAKLSYAFQL
jgi:hypothetical protein